MNHKLPLCPLVRAANPLYDDAASHGAEMPLAGISRGIARDLWSWPRYGRIASGFCLVIAGSLFSTNRSFAQVVSAPDAGSAAAEDIINLDPFEVDASKDVGYHSTNSISGTSLDTPIREIPMSIEVINRDFLDDTGAINFKEALQYSAGVVLEEYSQGSSNGLDGNNGPGVNETSSAEVSPSSRGGLGGNFSNAINIRGFNVAFQNRDGFRYGGQIAAYGVVLGGFLDASSLSRLEVVRGPNSLLYGIGVLSGIVNMIPKRPLSESAGSASVSVGNYDYRRATFDWTAPLKKDLWGGYLSYRVGAALTHRGDWTDYRESDLQYYVGQLEFQNDKWNVFFEAQYADQKESGIGAQFIYDNLAASIDQDFRNEYFEQFNWQKDFLGMPQTTRITGPDTYDRHEEVDLLLDLDFTPIENLTLSAGVFMTDLKEEEFNLNVSTLTNEERSMEFKGVLYQRLLLAERAAAKDPADRSPGESEQAVEAPFLRDWFDTYSWVWTSPKSENQAPNDPRELTDYRFVRYWWRKTPKTATTEQVRIRATYSFETKDFMRDARAKHTLLAGYHTIKDEADFTTGPEGIGRNYAVHRELATDDPLLERSVFNREPIRYNGEALAIPGREMRRADVWYTGLYGLYQGRLLNDNLGVIVGLRRDEYHSRDRIYNRFNNLEDIGDDFSFGPGYDGPLVSEAPSTIWWDNPNSETYGFIPPIEGRSEYAPGPDPESAVTKTLALNYRLSPALTVYGLRSEGLTPNVGARDGNNDPIASEQSSSEELGLKFDLMEGKLSGTVSVYRIRRENALWYLNSAPAPAKWLGALNPPTGFQADPSGQFPPADVESGVYTINYGINVRYFEADGIELAALDRFIYDDNGNPIGRVKERPEGWIGINGDAVFLQYDKLDFPVIDKNGVANGKTWRWYLEKAFSEKWRKPSAIPQNSSPEDYFSMDWRRAQGTGIGIHPSSVHPDQAETSGGGANVTFTDEAKGYDMQLIYQPVPSWQMVFTFAHTERQPITPFHLAEIVNQETGFQFGTEYDEWVRTFGRAAFGLEEHDDDGDGVVDRVTKQGENEVLRLGDVPASSLIGGLQGISLYTGPEDTFSLFQKYSFLEGSLRGFEATMGITYTGPAQTSIPIGGSDLVANRFGTPPTPERVVVNLGFAYKWKWGDQFYDARLQIFNLMDDQKGESFSEYTDSFGTIEPRRYTQYYTPRSFRTTLSVRF